MRWKKKLRAFLVALEVQHIDTLMKRATVKDYYVLGKTYAYRVKALAKKVEQNEKI